MKKFTKLYKIIRYLLFWWFYGWSYLIKRLKRSLIVKPLLSEIDKRRKLQLFSDIRTRDLFLRITLANYFANMRFALSLIVSTNPNNEHNKWVTLYVRFFD